MASTAPDDIYSLYQALKQYGREVRRDQRLPVPPADSVTVHSTLCGSQLTLDAMIDGDVVREIGYRVRACSLGQATTAIVAKRAPGLHAEALKSIGEQLRAILAGELTRSDWPELEVFALARTLSLRHGSALLPFQALDRLFERAGDNAAPADTDVELTTNSSGRN